MKKGDRIRIIRMDDCNGKDTQATLMSGRVVTVKLIDDRGQIHLEESGLALIPGLDDYEVIEEV
ncbi:MAG: DUF4314 domain-containing protein [Bacteroidales bacterium]|nr:DUF4314 domain-containing protein [Bacteroidales bacterium]